MMQSMPIDRRQEDQKRFLELPQTARGNCNPRLENDRLQTGRLQTRHFETSRFQCSELQRLD